MELKLGADLNEIGTLGYIIHYSLHVLNGEYAAGRTAKRYVIFRS